jgi:molybdopterin-guanine dinucleotide biosynthesis protein A
MPPDCPAPITALILAGGRGARMGGADKGLQVFNGTPLARHALLRLARQTLPPADVFISANRHLQDYRAFGAPVLPDSLPDFAGPLAGFLAGLTHCRTPLLLALPCDVPLFPLSLCERMAQALQGAQADVAVASASGGEARVRAQPVFCLMRAGLKDSLAAFLAAGGRKISDWTARQRLVMTAFDQPGDGPRAFANANTLAELRALENEPRSSA